MTRFKTGWALLGLALTFTSAQAHPQLESTTYFSRPAYRLTDGKTEAVVVPSIGRIMRYGEVNGHNLLWNYPTPDSGNGPWKNYGGDKNWLAPSSSWNVFHGSKNWPPDPAFDGTPQTARVLPGEKLEVTSPQSAGTGIRLIRTMYFAPNGDFVIEQTAKKESGGPIRASVWSINQTIPGQAIFLPLNSDSAYKGGYYALRGPLPVQDIEAVKPNLLRVKPALGKSYKIGLDSKVSRLVSVTGDMAFLVEAETPPGKYPDGAESNGFPIELYVSGEANAFYAELEVLGPLTDFANGTTATHTVRWSLHNLPSADISSPAVLKMVEELLYKP